MVSYSRIEEFIIQENAISKKKRSLTEGDYKKQILKMSLGMIVGMLGMSIFNIVDTIYVGRLGEYELAALAFTFPVVMIISSLSLGMGLGLSVTLSRVLGEKRFDKAARVTTHGLFLALLVVLIVAVTGFFTIRPLFTLIGAKGVVLDYVEDYMSIWYFSSMVVVVPMVGNNAIRATGDTKTPSIAMLISSVTNIVLDPILIFGWGVFPAMGVRGAALATVISRLIGFLIVLFILFFREKLITFQRTSFFEVWQTWKDILYIGIPTALVKMITPLAAGVITGLLAGLGISAVAGFGAGVKVEWIAMAFTMAVGASIGPFIGQNLGAKKNDRVLKGARYANSLAFFSGYAVFIVLFIFAGPISTLFSPVESVQKVMALYLRLAGLGYGMQGLFINSITILNVLKKPLYAAILSLIQMFGIYVPLAIIAVKFFTLPSVSDFMLLRIPLWKSINSQTPGAAGVFLALAVSFIVAGILASGVLKRVLESNMGNRSLSGNS